MWSPEVIDHVRPAGSRDFVAFLRGFVDLPHATWDQCELAEERGLEAWIGWLAMHDRRAYVTAIAAAARHAYPIVIDRAGPAAMESALHEDAPCADGVSEGRKVMLVEAWLASPSDAARKAVEEGLDPSRQLQIWDDDLRPSAEVMWQWFHAVGELAARAVVHKEQGAMGDPYTWPAAVCAARGTVCALKATRAPSPDVEAEMLALGRAIAAAFGD